MARSPRTMIPCPLCGKGYQSVFGSPPATITFRHPDGKECVRTAPSCACCGTPVKAGDACSLCAVRHDCDAGRRHPAYPAAFKQRLQEQG